MTDSETSLGKVESFSVAARDFFEQRKQQLVETCCQRRTQSLFAKKALFFHQLAEDFVEAQGVGTDSVVERASAMMVNFLNSPIDAEGIGAKNKKKYLYGIRAEAGLIDFFNESKWIVLRPRTYKEVTITDWKGVDFAAFNVKTETLYLIDSASRKISTTEEQKNPINIQTSVFRSRTEEQKVIQWVMRKMKESGLVFGINYFHLNLAKLEIAIPTGIDFMNSFGRLKPEIKERLNNLLQGVTLKRWI